MKRPLRWQLEKQRTAKGLLTLPKCEQCGIKRGLGFALNGLSGVCKSVARRRLEGNVSESEIDLPARPARKAPSRPWGWERAFWFHMPQHERRLHYRCCWLPQAAFNREDCERGRNGSWWLKPESVRIQPAPRSGT